MSTLPLCDGLEIEGWLHVTTHTPSTTATAGIDLQDGIHQWDPTGGKNGRQQGSLA